MIYRFLSIILAVLVVIASTAMSDTVTASEQPLLRDSNFKDGEDAIRTIKLDVPVSASSGGTEVIKVGAVTETEMKDENFKKSKEQHDRALYDDCNDDESFRHRYTNKKGRSKFKGGCTGFVARKKKKRCRKRTIDGRKIRDICRITCGSCKKKKKKVCSVERFIGSWRYTSPCKGDGVFELTVRCDDDEKTKKNNNMLCYVRDEKIMDAIDDGDLIDIKEDEICVTEGVFPAKDVVYDSINGNCLLPFVALDGGTCGDEIFREGLGVKAEIAAAAAVSDKKDDALMKIKFSRDEGESYYNDETPYEGYFVPSGGGGRSLLSTSLDNNFGNLKRRALSECPDTSNFKNRGGGDDPIVIGGHYAERCKSWNRKDDSKFPTTLLEEENHWWLTQADYCDDRQNVGNANSDLADGSFQRCFKEKDTDHYCWSNSAEYYRSTERGITVSKHIHCFPLGYEWFSSNAIKRNGMPLRCGDQCDVFSEDSGGDDWYYNMQRRYSTWRDYCSAVGS